MSAESLYYKTYNLKEDHAPTQIIYLIHDLYYSHKSFESFIEKYDLHNQEPTLFISIDLPGHGYHHGPRGHMEKFSSVLKSIAKIICETSSSQDVQHRSILTVGGGVSFSLACCVQNHLGINHLIDNVIAINPVFSLKDPKYSISHFIKKSKVFMKLLKRHECEKNSTDIKNQSLNLEKLSYSFIEEYKRLTHYLNSRSYFIDASTLFIFSSSFEEDQIELALLFLKGVDNENKKNIYLSEENFTSKKSLLQIQDFLSRTR